jgi:hypothetical protein
LYSRTPLIRINWDESHTDMQKIRIMWFFFEIFWSGKNLYKRLF